MSVVENYQQIREKVAAAATKAGRAPEEVHLLVVSKTWPAERLEPLIAVGHLAYGENRVQEAVEKAPLLPQGLEWHLIGHLQKNKARKALSVFQVFHSIDSKAIAQQIDRIAKEEHLYPRVYLQVNLGAEPQKHGFTPDDLRESMGDILTLPRLEILGLMAIPPMGSPEETRPYFRQLRELRDELREAYDHPLPGLSMGMTSDFDVAIEEGSTIVRVGSAIFGARG